MNVDAPPAGDANAWMSAFRPSHEMRTVREELGAAPEARFLPAVLVREVELEELAACVLPRTLDWFDEDVNPRRERWLNRRDFCAALFERAERNCDDGLHAFLWLRLTARLRSMWDKHVGRFAAGLHSVPERYRDDYACSVARSVARRFGQLLDDWLDYRAQLLAMLPQLHALVARLAAFVEANRAAKATIDARLGCPEGHYVDWCFTGVRGPGVVPQPDALRARLALLRDFRTRDPDMVPPVAWTPLPQRVQNVNDALIAGKEFEKLVVAAMRGAGCCASVPGRLLLDGVCLKVMLLSLPSWSCATLNCVLWQARRGHTMVTSRRGGVKQELDALLAHVGPAGECAIAAVVECKVNLRAAFGDADKFLSLMQQLRDGQCVLAQRSGPFAAGAALRVARDVPVPLVYLGAQDDVFEGALTWARSARNTHVSEQPSWIDILTLNAADGTYVLAEAFLRAPATRDRVLSDTRSVFARLQSFDFRVLDIDLTKVARNAMQNDGDDDDDEGGGSDADGGGNEDNNK